MEKKCIKIPNYSIYIFHVFFFPNCVPIATKSICSLLSSELFSIMSHALLVRQTVWPLNDCFAVYYFFARKLNSSHIFLTPVLYELNS